MEKWRALGATLKAVKSEEREFLFRDKGVQCGEGLSDDKFDKFDSSEMTEDEFMMDYMAEEEERRQFAMAMDREYAKYHAN